MRVFLIFSLCVTAIYSIPSKRGACVMMCMNDSECQTGYQCQSNGCGYECRRKSNSHHLSVLKIFVDFNGIILPKKRGSCLLMCGKYTNNLCKDGYECSSNGCGSECAFQAGYKQPDNCPTFSCNLHCPLGYTRDAQGCDHCKCDYSGIMAGRR